MADVDADDIDHLIRDLTVRKQAAPAPLPVLPVSPHRAPSASLPIMGPPAGARREDRSPFGRLMELRELMPSLPPPGRRRAFGRASLQALRDLPVLRDVLRLPGPVGIARLWVAIGVALAIGMLFWPYQKTYPAGLVFYILTLGLMLLSGIWGARLSWDARLGSAHTVSLMTACWAVALGTVETLPLI